MGGCGGTSIPPVVVAGANVIVTGSGTPDDPYRVNAGATSLQDLASVVAELGVGANGSYTDVASRLDDLPNVLGGDTAADLYPRAGDDPLPTSAITTAPVMTPASGTSELLYPSGLSDVTDWQLTAGDVGKARWVAFDIAGDSEALVGIALNVITPASGGGTVTTPIAGTDDANFDTSISHWVAITNCSVVRTTTNPESGAGALRMTATAAGHMLCGLGGGAGALNNRLTVAAGDTLDVSMKWRAVGTPRGGCRIDVSWFDSSHAFISQVNGSTTITDTTTGYTTVSQTFTAPAGAVSARIIAEASNGSIGAGEQHQIDTVSVTRTQGGGASGAQFRLALCADDGRGQSPNTSLPPAVITGVVDATIGGGDRQFVWQTAFDPAAVPQRVFAEFVYQESVAPGTRPKIKGAITPIYAPLTTLGITAGSPPRFLTQTGVTGALAGSIPNPNGSDPNGPLLALTLAPAPAPVTGTVRWGLTKKHSSGQLVTVISGVEGTFGKRSTATRIYKKWDSTFPDADDTGYVGTFNGFTGRLLTLSIDFQRTNGSLVDPASIAAAGPGDSLYSEIVAWANALTAFPHPVIVSWQHEMESPNVSHLTSAQAADYVAAIRNICSIVTAAQVAAGASNVKHAFDPTANGYKTNAANAFYPGDDVVDMIAADGYNWSNTRGNKGTWTPWNTVFSGLLAFAAQHPTNPTTGKTIEIGILEVGCVPDKDVTRRAAWWLDALHQIKTDSRWSRLTIVLPWDNHDNAFDPNNPGHYANPAADFTNEKLVTLDPAHPNNTPDTNTIAALLTVLTDPVMV